MGSTDFAETQCLNTTPILLLPLWAVRPVQSFNACTVQLYLYCHCGPYGLRRASEPVQYSYTSIVTVGRTACTEPECLYNKAIPLLPLWAVQTVQSLSACTVQLYPYCHCGPYRMCRASVSVQYNYTSIATMVRTACAEPLSLYIRTIHLFPLWALSSVQSLSACTVQLYTYCHCGPYRLYRASVSVQ